MHRQNRVRLSPRQVLVLGTCRFREWFWQQSPESLVLDEPEPKPHQTLLGRRWIGRGLDELDDPIDIAYRQDQTLQHVCPLPRPPQEKRRPAADNVLAVIDEELDHLLEVQRSRLSPDDGDVHDDEIALERRELIKPVDDHVLVGFSL